MAWLRNDLLDSAITDGPAIVVDKLPSRVDRLKEKRLETLYEACDLSSSRLPVA